MGRTSGSTSSTEGSPAPAGELVPVAELLRAGRVVGAHGLRGQLRMRLDGEADAWLAPGTSLVLASEGAAAGRRFQVEAAAPGRRGEWRVTLAGVADRDAAEALRGRDVHVAAGELAPLEEGEFYAYQVVGCRLEDEQGRPVGRVTGIWETGSDVLVVEADDGAERLVPAALLREVDPGAGRAVAEIPPGLLEEG